MDLRVLRMAIVVSLVAHATGEYLVSSHSSEIATEAIFDASGRLFPRTSHILKKNNVSSLSWSVCRGSSELKQLPPPGAFLVMPAVQPAAAASTVQELAAHWRLSFDINHAAILPTHGDLHRTAVFLSGLDSCSAVVEALAREVTPSPASLVYWAHIKAQACHARFMCIECHLDWANLTAVATISWAAPEARSPAVAPLFEAVGPSDEVTSTFVRRLPYASLRRRLEAVQQTQSSSSVRVRRRLLGNTKDDSTLEMLIDVNVTEAADKLTCISLVITQPQPFWLQWSGEAPLLASAGTSPPLRCTPESSDADESNSCSMRCDAAEGLVEGHCSIAIQRCLASSVDTQLLLSIPVRRALVRTSEYPADVHRGFDLAPAVVQATLHTFTAGEKSTFWAGELVTSSTLIPVPSPDFSMPLNAITLGSTALAFFIGLIFNVIGRAPRRRAPLPISSSSYKPYAVPNTQ